MALLHFAPRLVRRSPTQPVTFEGKSKRDLVIRVSRASGGVPTVTLISTIFPNGHYVNIDFGRTELNKNTL